MLTLRVMGHDFDPNQLTIVCCHVVAGAPIAEVAHDVDRIVQIFCAQYGHEPTDVGPTHLHHLVAELERLAVPTVCPGQYAQLSEGVWTVRDMPPEQEES